LRDALNKTGEVAFGSFVMRNKESLCLIKPVDKVLVLYKIRWGQEVRSTEDLAIPSGVSKPAELKMAVQLIDQLSGPFDIENYKDTYSDELMKLIHAKAKGKKPPKPVMKVVHKEGKDLLSQLKASLQGSGGKKKKAS
jgi:DNA end-binding protein Ku